MSTYSNAPSVSNFIAVINRQNVNSAPWTFNGFPEFTAYTTLFTCPANSYAIIRGGIRAVSMNAGETAGISMLSITSFQQSTVPQKINKSTCMAMVGGTTFSSTHPQFDDSFENIYVGPGQEVYGVAVSNGGTPSSLVEIVIQGTVFTNGS